MKQENMEKTNFHDFLSDIQEGHENALEIIKKLDEHGKEIVTLAVHNRKLNPEPPEIPPRNETRPRNHIFHDPVGFAKYLKKEGGECAVVLANTQDMEVKAVLDESEKFGVEIITLKPQIHPLMKPWQKLIDEGPVSVIEFAKTIMANRRSVENGKELALMFSQVMASENVKMYSGAGAKSINGLICEVEVSGGTEEVPITLPDTIEIAAPLYVGMDAETYTLDLTLGVSDHKPIVQLTSADLVIGKVEAFESFLSLIELGNAVVTRGIAAYTDWDYIGRN